ncbi:hypothetical protein K4F52_009387 [Lecanicillium sp. MT-2017a]|nr:hypothetical protein K4F52_009387 [Lecanicillium sp. MT-2017a]
MSAPIKKVTLVGPSGNLGETLFKAFVNSGKFDIQVLRRHGSKRTYPNNVKVVDVDFTSVESLVEPLKGQDAVVSTLAEEALDLQINIIDAAILAGVRRFVPSEFGSNLDNKNTRALPVFARKVKTQDYLIEKAKTTSLTYTFVYNGPFLDWGLEHHFILNTSEYKPSLFDGGVQLFSTTTLETISQATIALLEHPQETKNRAVYIEDIQITQKRLYELARQVAPEKPWAPSVESLDELRDKGFARAAQGIFDMETVVSLISQALFRKDGGGIYEKTDNALLGVKGKTEQDVVEMFKKVLQ